MIDEGIDTGALIGQARCSIQHNDDVAHLFFKHDLLGARLLVDGIRFLFEKSAPIAAPENVSSVYRSTFTVFDTIIYVMRRHSFFKKFERPEEYSLGNYLKQ